LNKTKESDSEEDMQLGFWQLLKSTLSAFLGVQSTANRERDFRHGKLSHFIWMGLLFGLVFVLTLIGVVQLVMHFASN
jgi:diacylglycerol kinase